MDYGSAPYIADSEKLLKIAISETSYAVSATELAKEELKESEDTIDSLRERLRAESDRRIEAEIANKAWELRYEKIRTCLHLSDDPEEARKQLEIHNSLRLGLIPINSAVSSETHSKQVEVYCKPSILELAKDITKLGLFYDGIIHLGALVKQELNKVDTKTKVKLKFEAKIAETEKKREEPKVKPGRKVRTEDEKHILAYMKVPAFRSMPLDELVNLVKTTAQHLTGEQIETIIHQLNMEIR